MISEQIQQLFASSVKDTKAEDIQLSTPQSSEHGDLSTNIAMINAKKEDKNPRELAQEIIDKLPKHELVEKLEIAGPGFINIWYSDAAYEQMFQNLLESVQSNKLGTLSTGTGKTAITDSSHPNIAKPMGVHHLLSTIIGQALNNLLDTSGYKLIKDNYLGDWGTQYGKLIFAIQCWGDMEVIKKDPIPELLKLYVKFHEEAEKDEELENKGRDLFKKLEQGDEELLKMWKWIKEVSIENCSKTWDRLGAEFDMINSESFYEKMMQPIIDQGLEMKVIQEGEKSALIIEMDDENKPPAIIRKSDGATLYATRDLARIKYWQDELHGDLGINVVDVAQKLYFEQLFESAEKLGFTKMKHVHVEFGRMEFPDGGISTRKGKVVLLEDVLDEAEKRALQKIKDHNSELPEDEQIELARVIGIGAVKYNVLSQNRNKNYTFDWDVMLSFDGNSAPYLQYAYTRTQSLLRRAQDEVIHAEASSPKAAEERQLLKKILDFEASIERSLAEYKPSHLCTYLFELAQNFSQFYNNLRILDAETPEEVIMRLRLVESTGYVLKKGLGILGVEVPERM